MAEFRCTAVVPSVSNVRPERVKMLERAMNSVVAQEEPTDWVVSFDEDHDPSGPFVPGGAARTRNAGIQAVDTEWTAFLDDDDVWYPHHVSRCLELADQTGADLVYPWWDGANESLFRVPKTSPAGEITYDTPEGRPFDDELRDFLLGDCDWQDGYDNANYLPITVVVKTEFLTRVGGFPIPGTDEWPHPNSEDHGLWIRLLRAGAKFEHLPERTWRYVFHGQHLSGA